MVTDTDTHTHTHTHTHTQEKTTITLCLRARVNNYSDDLNSIKMQKQGRDQFRHNHYPMLIVQVLKFSSKKCPICRVMILSEYIPTYFFIERKLSLYLTNFCEIFLVLVSHAFYHEYM